MFRLKSNLDYLKEMGKRISAGQEKLQLACLLVFVFRRQWRSSAFVPSFLVPAHLLHHCTAVMECADVHFTMEWNTTAWAARAQPWPTLALLVFQSKQPHVSVLSSVIPSPTYSLKHPEEHKQFFTPGWWTKGWKGEGGDLNSHILHFSKPENLLCVINDESRSPCSDENIQIINS